MIPAKPRITLTALAVCLAACGGGQSSADANPRAGSAMSSPVELPLNGQRNGQIADEHGFWFWVETTQAGQLDFQTLGELDTYCGLYNANGGSLAVDYDSGDVANCRVTHQVAPGQYFYWVIPSSEADRGSFVGNVNFLVQGDETGGSEPPGGGVTPPDDSGPINGGMASRYIDNRDGTVTDKTTGLRWMRCVAGQSWNGSGCSGVELELDWHDMVNLSQSFAFANERGWRLPSRTELLSIVHCSSGLPAYWSPSPSGCRGSFNDPTVDSVAFPGVSSLSYWTGENYDTDPSKAFVVNFWSGDGGTHQSLFKDIAIRAVFVK